MALSVSEFDEGSGQHRTLSGLLLPVDTRSPAVGSEIKGRPAPSLFKDDTYRVEYVQQWPVPHRDNIILLAPVVSAHAYISVSKDGTIGLWKIDTFEHIHTFHHRGSSQSSGMYKPHLTDLRGSSEEGAWINSALYLADQHLLIVASDDFRIYFYQLSITSRLKDLRCICTLHCGGVHRVSIRVTHEHDPKASIYVPKIEHVPLCLDYGHMPSPRDKMSVLVCGDDGGFVTVVQWPRDKVATLEKGLAELLSPQRMFDAQDDRPRGIWKRYPVVNVSETKDGESDDEQPSATPRHSDESSPHRQGQWMTQVKFLPALEAFAVSFEDPDHSLFVGSLKQRSSKTTQSATRLIWKIKPFGVTCFDYWDTGTLSFIITGGKDTLLQIWKPTITKETFRVLTGHRAPILSVQVCKDVICSMDAAKLIRIWDLKNFECQHELLDMERHRPADRHSFMLIDPMRHRVMAASTRFTVWHLQTQLEGQSVSTHQSTVVGAIYEPLSRSIITGVLDGTLSVWDVRTGKLLREVKSAHGDEELVSIALADGSRFLSASRTGGIRVWKLDRECTCFKVLKLSPDPVENARLTSWAHGMGIEITAASLNASSTEGSRSSLNGRIDHRECTCVVELMRELHKMDRDENTAILSTSKQVSNTSDDVKLLVCVGWNRKVCMWRDISEPSSEDNRIWREMPLPVVEDHVHPIHRVYRPSSATKPPSRGSARPPRVWVESGHKEDILCTAYLAPATLATGSYDGEIIIWNLNSQRRQMRFSVPEAGDGSVHASVLSLVFISGVAGRKLLLSGCANGRIHLWDLGQHDNSKRLLDVFVTVSFTPTPIALAQFASSIFVGDGSGRVTQFDLVITRSGVVTLNNRRDFQAHSAAIVSLTVFRYEEAAYMMTSALDLAVRMWAVIEGEPTARYLGTFGQLNPWNLDPSPFRSPPNDVLIADARHIEMFATSSLDASRANPSMLALAPKLRRLAKSRSRGHLEDKADPVIPNTQNLLVRSILPKTIPRNNIFRHLPVDGDWSQQKTTCPAVEPIAINAAEVESVSKDAKYQYFKHRYKVQSGRVLDAFLKDSEMVVEHSDKAVKSILDGSFLPAIDSNNPTLMSSHRRQAEIDEEEEDRQEEAQLHVAHTPSRPSTARSNRETPRSTRVKYQCLFDETHL